MFKTIKNIIIMIIIIISTYIGTLIITNPHEALNKIDTILYKITGKYYLTDTNEKINKEEIIAIAKNKDYSNSIYYPYYELLNDNQKKVYKDIIYNANNYNTTFKPSAQLNNTELKEVFEAVFYDHPEIFWLDSSYYVLSIQNIIKIKFTDIINDIDNAKKQFNNEINKIVTEANKQETDYEKELYVHNTLINLIEYDENEENHQNAYDAIINKKAVCAGYTKLFQIIMIKLRIPTYYITGYSENETHSWNLIELEDGFYNVDVTWDDHQNKIMYKYFNINDEMINKDHLRRGLSAKLTKLNGKKYINKLSSLYEYVHH